MQCMVYIHNQSPRQLDLYNIYLLRTNSSLMPFREQSLADLETGKKPDDMQLRGCR